MCIYYEYQLIRKLKAKGSVQPIDTKLIKTQIEHL